MNDFLYDSISFPSMALGLPVGQYEGGGVIVSVGDTGILHINGIAMSTPDFAVKRSTIDGAEWGLFANRAFPVNKNRRALEYKGDLLRMNKFTQAIKDRGYSITFSAWSINAQFKEGYRQPHVAIDAYPYVTGTVQPLERIGGFANHSRAHPNVITTEDNNTTYDIDEREYYRLFMYVIHPIKSGDEILWDYGTDYWNKRGGVPKED